jgi:[ribosomal protein S18]-alanine N-acetyltransferase
VTGNVRAMRGRDVRQVLAIEWQAFPDDPWTAVTAKGWLARATAGGGARHAAGLARFIRFIRLHRAIGLIKLTCLLALDQPPGLRYIVAEAEDGEIAGYACLCTVRDGEASIPMIAVRPDRQGQKIGTHLLSELIALAAAGGCRDVSLYVRADNPGARRLYRRTGFTEVGVRPGFYQPSGTDAIVMRRPGRNPAKYPSGPPEQGVSAF